MKTLAKRPWVAALALCVLATTQVRSHAGQPTDPKIPFEKYKLPNGLEVILLEDHKTPIVYVSLWYHVGSGDEVAGRSGFAHLFEHMMFQGTKHTGEDAHFKILKQIGVSNVNGTTNNDRTNYFEQVPSNQLETALWLESDRMGYLLDVLDEKALKNQIEVVRNERRQSIDNQPYAVDFFAYLAALYPEGHPYRYSVIGRHEDLEAASVDDVKNFFRKWYVPANATIVIAGDIDVPATKKLVDKWFGDFPTSEKPKHKLVPAPALAKTSRQTVEDPLAKLRQVHYAWHSPARFAEGDADLGILAYVLGDESTGRLVKALKIDRQLATLVSVDQGGLGMSGTFEIAVNLRPDADQAEVEKIINAELDKALSTPITDREYKRAVVNTEASFIRRLAPVRARGEMLQTCNHDLGVPDCVSIILDAYRNATPASVQAAAKKYLGAPRVEVITMPKGGK
jgi:predicted Zn-dependent peptidase